MNVSPARRELPNDLDSTNNLRSSSTLVLSIQQLTRHPNLSLTKIENNKQTLEKQ